MLNTKIIIGIVIALLIGGTVFITIHIQSNDRQGLQDARVKQAQKNVQLPIRGNEPIVDKF